MMAQFNFTVDTEPMAKTIHHIAPHVDGTTTAVVAMQTAVIVAEKKAAEKICDNVNRGFFGLIRSQISQKLAICKSQMDARLMELAHQSMGLTSIRGRMEKDFQMIATRYGKLFRTLDAALLSRVNELDKPLVEFVRKGVDQGRSRSQSVQASVPIHQTESVTLSQSLVVSQAKVSTARALDFMRRFVGESNQQKGLVVSMLVEGGGGGSIHLPVVFVEFDSPGSHQTQWQFHYPPAAPGLARKMAQEVENHVLGAGSPLQWQEPAAEVREPVTRIFRKLVQASPASERVQALMTQLYNTSSWQVGLKAQP